MANLEKRFWSKVNKRSENECWPWLGAKHERGYGQFWIGKDIPIAHKKRGTNHYATHVMLYLIEGTWDKDSCILHACDNPNCVNPKHLTRGTQKENIEDREIKGRNKPRIRIPLNIHNAIKNSPSNLTHTYVAKKYGVSTPHVSRVRRGLTRAYE